jgi:hypothetical protein
MAKKSINVRLLEEATGRQLARVKAAFQSKIDKNAGTEMGMMQKPQIEHAIKMLEEGKYDDDMVQALMTPELVEKVFG